MDAEVVLVAPSVSSVGLAPDAGLCETLSKIQAELGELRQAHTTCKKWKLDRADDVDLCIEALSPTHGQKSLVKSAHLCPTETHVPDEDSSSDGGLHLRNAHEATEIGQGESCISFTPELSEAVPSFYT